MDTLMLAALKCALLMKAMSCGISGGDADSSDRPDCRFGPKTAC